jgi:hypothetical protein
MVDPAREILMPPIRQSGACVVLLVLLGCVQARRSSPIERSEDGCVVRAGCAACIFKMEGVSDCLLAVKIDETPYLVVGSDIDDHGDAHAADGMCNVARMARVRGRISRGAFRASAFQLLPE